jgi:NAD(P)-dependent dehydrogenase (short-subunit alcohol dehydrogenase family)
MSKPHIVTAPRPAYLVTGPTSGVGYRTALELARHGSVILVGRDRGRLAAVQRTIAKQGGQAVTVTCDLSDLASVKRAAAEIVALRLPIAGVVNNAGIIQQTLTTNARGWDMTFATNHLGPFALTEALVPHLPDGANVVFVASAVEDPERKPAVAAGFRGARYLSAQASAQGKWLPGGSAKPGMDAYATSKQCNLVTAMRLSRETPRLRFNAVEPGFNPATGLSRDAPLAVRVLLKVLAPVLVPLLLPFVPYMSTSRRAARVIAHIVTEPTGLSGVYFDEGGRPKAASALARDAAFQDRVVDETRALLAAA